MPIINVTIPTGVFDQSAQAAIAVQLTDILMEIEGTKGIAAFAAGTWLTLNEVGPHAIAVGGHFVPGRSIIIINTPSGALSVEKKAELISRVTDAMLRIEGVEPNEAQRARVYCLINEIPEGGWGFAGQALTRERVEALRRSIAQGRPQN